MRNTINLVLVALLLACPTLCRAGEEACCRGEDVQECSQEPGHSAPSPIDEDGCICSGAALKADDGQATQVHPGLNASVLDLPGATPGLIAAVLGQGRSISQPHERSQHVRLHARLEVHRC